MSPFVVLFSLCLWATASANNVTKRDAQYDLSGQELEPAISPRAIFGYGAPNLDASFGAVGAVSGGKCRDITKFLLTWTSTKIPVTVYATRNELLPTTLYQYVTETGYYPHTTIQLQTTVSAIRPGYREDTLISYSTLTVVLPQVESVTSTLLLTDDEHVTITETDRLTQTVLKKYPVTVTDTSEVRVPEIVYSTLIKYETLFETQVATHPYDVVVTSTLNVPHVTIITKTKMVMDYATVRLTKTRAVYETVTDCGQQSSPGYY